MVRAYILLMLLVAAVARPQDESEEPDGEESSQAPRPPPRHMIFNGAVVQPDESVITADRVRALLRGGFTAVKLGNQTLASFNPQKKEPETPLPKASTAPPTKHTSPPPTTEETLDEAADSDEPASALPSTSTKHGKLTSTGFTSSPLPTTSDSAFITDVPPEEENSPEGTQKPKKRVRIHQTFTTESEEATSATPAADLQVLQAQFKRIKSATVRNASAETEDSTDEPPSATTDRYETATINLLAQVLRGFDSLSSPTPPPSPFELSKKVGGSRKRLTPTPSPEDEIADATIPFEEATTTTTEVPMPPPQPDFVPAGKQLSPFVSGVKSLDSGSTRDALDAASQMGRLTWLVNYYENSQQGQVGTGQQP